MKQSELVKLIEGGQVGCVVFFNWRVEKGDNPILGPDWQVWCWGVDGDNTALEPFGNRLDTERGTPKTYTSLDRALVALRGLGWKGVCEIDG